MRPYRPNPASRPHGFAWPWRSYLARGLVVSIIGCSSPADPHPDSNVLLEVDKAIDEQGVFSPILLSVTALDDVGDPLAGLEVRWAARHGLVGEWFMGNRSRAWEQEREAVRVTGPDGKANLNWILGPNLEVHAVEVSAPGAAPIEVYASALAGVVLVGLWRLPDQQAQDALPSDTIRLHASNYYDWALPRTLSDFEEGGELVIVGDVVAGTGIDTTWVFHLHPASIRTLRPPVFNPGQCIIQPPLTAEELGQMLGPLVSRRLCAPLLLVDIEEYTDG